MRLPKITHNCVRYVSIAFEMRIECANSMSHSHFVQFAQIQRICMKLSSFVIHEQIHNTCMSNIRNSNYCVFHAGVRQGFQYTSLYVILVLSCLQFLSVIIYAVYATLCTCSWNKMQLCMILARYIYFAFLDRYTYDYRMKHLWFAELHTVYERTVYKFLAGFDIPLYDLFVLLLWI